MFPRSQHNNLPNDPARRHCAFHVNLTYYLEVLQQREHISMDSSERISWDMHAQLRLS